MKGTTTLLMPAVLLCLGAAYAGDSDIKVTPSGSVYYQIGQLEHTFDQSVTWPNKTLDQRCDFRLAFSAEVQKHLQIIAGIELAMVTQIQPPLPGGHKGTTISGSYAFPREGQGIYTFGDDRQNALLQIAVGYFPFKYNPQATDMGEYLFRTGTYPPFIINDFDDCQARLLGLRVSSTLSPLDFLSLRQDLLFTSETYFPPVGDYSLSYLASCKIAKIAEVGAGISLCRVLPLDPKQTTDESAQGIIYDNNFNPVIQNGDTLRYTFKGTKFMARFSFDPKQLFPSPTLPALQLGPEDCKIYGEYAMLGIKNYGYFNDLKKRTPGMVGFNVPTYPAITYAILPGALMFRRYFKVNGATALIGGAGLAAGIGSTFLELTKGDYFQKKLRLDLLSVEFEYFDFNYDQFGFPPNTDPNAGLGFDNLALQYRFHWSIVARKTIVNGLCIKLLVGKDHYRNTGTNTGTLNGVDNPVGTGSNEAGGELLLTRSDWHYCLRAMYSF